MHFRTTVDGIEARVVRKKVRNVNLRVGSPDGEVLVSLPERCSVDVVRATIRDNKTRIMEARRAIRARKAPAAGYVTGERHASGGREYACSSSSGTGRGRSFCKATGWFCVYGPVQTT